MNFSSTVVTAPSRRRISQACDRCHELRTRCNGQLPCSHCIEYGLVCEYVRQKKKRGKIAGQRRTQGTAIEHLPSSDQVANNKSSIATIDAAPSAAELVLRTPVAETIHNMEHSAHAAVSGFSFNPSVENDVGIDYPGAQMDHDMLDFSVFNSINIRGASSMDAGLLTEISGPLQMPLQSPSTRSNSQSTGSPSHVIPQGSPISASLSGNARGNGLQLQSQSPPVSLVSQPHLNRPNVSAGVGSPSIRYPVLASMERHLHRIISMESAQDLLEFYFSSSWSNRMHPASPYVLGFVLRKASILHPTSPRTCQKALLASMLWVAAQTCDLNALTSAPYVRGQVCDTLMKLTLKLLKSTRTPSMSSDNMATLDLDRDDVEDAGKVTTSWHECQLDNVITYIHLAVVASASEFKGTSIKWWSMAWELARQLKLGREVVASAKVPTMPNLVASPSLPDHHTTHYPTQSSISEEHREERRRVWWLLYAVDRHLALCYNRPLTLLDAECQDLRQPMNDADWEAGVFTCQEDGNSNTAGGESSRHRTIPVGPQMTCSGYSIFGYFLPLMTILGDIVDLHHSKSHRKFKGSERVAELWNIATDEVRENLRLYEESVQKFEQQSTAGTTTTGFLESMEPNHSDGTDSNTARRESSGSKDDANSNRLLARQATIMRSVMILPNGYSTRPNPKHTSRTTEPTQVTLNQDSSQTAELGIQTRIVAAYSRHLLHVLHILLADRWDPVSLFDDNDPWISSQSFITSTNHAVLAADEIGKILQFDPGLDFMPFFWGIYLLQGSFLPLFIASMLQRQTSPPIVKTCETLMQAYQASVATLRTEYQHEFSKLMGTAIAAIRGRVPSDIEKHHKSQMELLGRYRWNNSGTGLLL